MKQVIDDLCKAFEQELSTVGSLKEIEPLRVKYLGKKGIIPAQMQNLRHVSQDMKPTYGKWINDLKLLIEEGLSRAESSLFEREVAQQMLSEHLDVTLPGRSKFLPARHPMYQIMDEVVDVFVSMGFSIVLSPEIETEYYNFEVLNFQPDHPARDMQDTFYIEPGVLLRTHATTFQGRLMEMSQPPFRVVCPGRVYRNESVSARSHVFFHQVDGLYVAENVSFQDLIATMQEFIHKLFHQDVAVRFRPSYFPFVEPGTEVDIGCLLCSGKGCSLCKHSGWLEILGAGMVHPQVLRNCGLDPEKYSGYAWGLGVERIVLLKYGITDIRLLAENDLRFLRQFARV